MPRFDTYVDAGIALHAQAVLELVMIPLLERIFPLQVSSLTEVSVLQLNPGTIARKARERERGL